MNINVVSKYDALIHAIYVPMRYRMASYIARDDKSVRHATFIASVKNNDKYRSIGSIYWMGLWACR